MTENPNKNQIAALEESLKAAYGAKDWVKVKTVAEELKALDPVHRLAAHLLEKIEEQGKTMNRKVHAEEINRLQDDIAKAFKTGRFNDVGTLSENLLKMDPENTVVKTYKNRITEAKAALEKKRLEALKPKKPNFFARLQSWVKTNRAKASVPTQTVVPTLQPPISQPGVFQALAAKVDNPSAPEKGNTFTHLFGKKEGSIIETIVSKTTKPDIKPVKIEKPKEKNGTSLLRFSSSFLQFTVAFMVITAGFFYAQNKDVENWIFGLAGKENYASRLHKAAAMLEAKQEEERTLNREIKKYESGYNNRYEEIIKQVIENRLNWPDILDKINEITNTVYERNELSQYIQYSGFSFDAEQGVVRVSGTLSDPLGKNLTKLAELEEAFRSYPDEEKPYFYHVNEFNSLRKSLDKKTGRFSSSFQLSFSTKPDVKP